VVCKPPRRLTGRSPCPRFQPYETVAEDPRHCGRDRRAVLVVLSFVLDGILTSKAREEAQKLSQEWEGRSRSAASRRVPHRAGAVSPTSDRRRSRRDLALVDLKLVEVKVALLRPSSPAERASRSAPRKRRLDGQPDPVPDVRTNLESSSRAFAEGRAKPKDEKPSDLSSCRSTMPPCWTQGWRSSQGQPRRKPVPSSTWT